MIPKIIHYCWFGTSDMPQEYLNNIQTWRELHPDWEFRFWHESNFAFDDPYLINAKEKGNWANISNHIRLSVLHKFGGIYLDTDFMVIKPFDTLLQNECFMGFESGDAASTDFTVNNALSGSIPEHHLTDNCLRFLTENFDGREQANLSGPVLITNVLKNTYHLNTYKEQVLDGVRIFEKDVFYPLPFEKAYDTQNVMHYVSDNTYAVHLWGRSWYSHQDLIQRIDSQDRFIEERIEYIKKLEDRINSTNNTESAAAGLAAYQNTIDKIFTAIEKVNFKLSNQEDSVRLINNQMAHMESLYKSEVGKNQLMPVIDFLVSKISDLENKLNEVRVSSAVAEKKAELDYQARIQELDGIRNDLYDMQKEQEEMLQAIQQERMEMTENMLNAQAQTEATITKIQKEYDDALNAFLDTVKTANTTGANEAPVKAGEMPNLLPQQVAANSNEEKAVLLTDESPSEIHKALAQENEALNRQLNQYKTELEAKQEETARLNFKVNSLTAHIDNFPHVRSELEQRIRLLEELIQKMRLKNRAKRLFGLYKPQ